jgi:hypothetical protein
MDPAGRVTILEDQLNAYQNALRVCRDAMHLVLMREQEQPLGPGVDYVVVDGGSLTMALEFTKDMTIAGRDNLRARVQELEEAHKNVLYGPENGLDKWEREHGL